LREALFCRAHGCFWHKADITIALTNVRFWGEADMAIVRDFDRKQPKT